MAIFKRSKLQEIGLNDDQISYVMNEAGRVFAGYVPQSEVQTKIDEALAALPKPVDVKTSPEYLDLLKENNKIKAIASEDFAKVKSPYREMVWDRLEHGEGHKPYGEQLTEMAAIMPDLFAVEQAPAAPPEPQHKPQFGTQPEGQMPTGKTGPSFMDTWGFVPKK